MTLPIFIFWSVLVLLTYTDIVSRKIPLIIIIPSIMAGLWFNRDILSVSLMLVLGLILYRLKFWYGGDVKLMMFIASFLSYQSFTILFMALGCIYLYRFIAKEQKNLPATPFILSGTILYFLFDVVIPNTLIFITKGTRCG